MAWFRAPGNPGGSLKVRTASGRIATFTTNIVDLLQEVKCSINPIQNGTPWIDSNEVNKEPYIKRNVAGTATRIGNHLYDKLVGVTVPFNQKVASYSNNASTVVDNQDGTLTATSNAQVYCFGIAIEAVGHSVLKTDIDHKYFFYTKVLSSNISNFRDYGLGNWTDGPALLTQVTGEFAKIVRSKNDTVGTYFNVTTTGTSLSTDTFTCTKPILIDLTQMFGSTIADYIYSLEQATAGAGVAFFKALFPKDYYAYNAGELMSVKATAHVMKNASNQVIGNYALDSNLELRGIPKLVNNKLEYDGDTYESSGAVGRRYGIVDLGSLSWTYNKTTWSNPIFYAQISDKANGFNMICVPYITSTTGGIGGLEDKHIIGSSSNYIYIRDSAYTDAATFKTEMSGVYLVYEKATPTTEQASPFTNPQVCDENGTEEYVDSRAVAIPVGHETYQANICEITGFDELNIKQSGQDMSEIAKLIKLEFDNTVYLAEVSCLNGVWKLKLLGAEVDLGDLSWYPGACALENKYTMRSDGIANLVSAPPSSSVIVDILCPIYPTVIGDSTYLGNTGISILRGGNLAVFDDRYSTIDSANAFKSAMSGVKLVYPLATPTEITLDETEQFEALIGINNVWHDANGDTEVKYLEVVRN